MNAVGHATSLEDAPLEGAPLEGGSRADNALASALRPPRGASALRPTSSRRAPTPTPCAPSALPAVTVPPPLQGRSPHERQRQLLVDTLRSRALFAIKRQAADISACDRGLTALSSSIQSFQAARTSLRAALRSASAAGESTGSLHNKDESWPTTRIGTLASIPQQQAPAAAMRAPPLPPLSASVIVSQHLQQADPSRPVLRPRRGTDGGQVASAEGAVGSGLVGRSCADLPFARAHGQPALDVASTSSRGVRATLANTTWTAAPGRAMPSRSALLARPEALPRAVSEGSRFCPAHPQPRSAVSACSPQHRDPPPSKLSAVSQASDDEQANDAAVVSVPPPQGARGKRGVAFIGVGDAEDGAGKTAAPGMEPSRGITTVVAPGRPPSKRSRAAGAPPLLPSASTTANGRIDDDDDGCPRTERQIGAAPHCAGGVGSSGGGAFDSAAGVGVGPRGRVAIREQVAAPLVHTGFGEGMHAPWETAPITHKEAPQPSRKYGGASKPVGEHGAKILKDLNETPPHQKDLDFVADELSWGERIGVVAPSRK